MARKSDQANGSTVLDREPEVSDASAEPPFIPGIRCPLCRWRPGPNDRWFC